MLSCFSCVQLIATLWTIVCKAPLSMGFSRQEYWSELPCPPPWDLPDPEIEPVSLTSPALAGGFFFFLTLVPCGKTLILSTYCERIHGGNAENNEVFWRVFKVFILTQASRQMCLAPPAQSQLVYQRNIQISECLLSIF